MFEPLFYRFISDQAKMLMQRAFQISTLADENFLRFVRSYMCVSIVSLNKS
jgi:hypothetical protein